MLGYPFSRAYNNTIAVIQNNSWKERHPEVSDHDNYQRSQIFNWCFLSILFHLIQWLWSEQGGRYASHFLTEKINNKENSRQELEQSLRARHCRKQLTWNFSLTTQWRVRTISDFRVTLEELRLRDGSCTGGHTPVPAQAGANFQICQL